MKTPFFYISQIAKQIYFTRKKVAIYLNSSLTQNEKEEILKNLYSLVNNRKNTKLKQNIPFTIEKNLKAKNDIGGLIG